MSDDPSVVRATPVPPRGAAPLIERQYVVLAALVLGLTAFNLFFRLGREFVSEWDESLYAITASEALKYGHWVGTTFLGGLDYYNTKPPLNVWLIALAFKLFGTNLVALRLASVLSAWTTVLVLMIWTRRAFGAAVSIGAGIILATSFGFVHVHAGRSANTDAIFTLLLLLTVVTLWASARRPALQVWLGPILAAVFLLRGMAILMPLVLIGMAWLLGRRPAGAPRAGWRVHAATIALFALPVGGWIIARYRVDQWAFLKPLFWYDFVARTVSVIEEHPGGPFYYLGILTKHQYDWMIAAVVALLLAPISWRGARRAAGAWRESPVAVVSVAWAAATLVIPAAMRTKVPWYLNPFYPLFATLIAWAIVRGLRHAASLPSSFRARALAAVVVLVAGVAETKLVAYSFQYRDLRLSDQGLILAERHRLSGRRVYRNQKSRGATFVAAQLVGADAREVPNIETFLQDSRPDDYLVTTDTIDNPDLELIRTGAGFNLYRRCEPHERQARTRF